MSVPNYFDGFEAGERYGRFKTTQSILKRLLLNEGEWHRREDCKTEGRLMSCCMCRLFKRLEKDIRSGVGRRRKV